MAEFNLRMQKYHDGSILSLRLYMFQFWMSYQNKRFFESYLPAFKRSKDKKNFIVIISEIIKLTFIWKCVPYHYFRYGLYRSKYNFSKILDFLPETVFYYQILPKINKHMFLLDDKSVFEEMLKGQGINFPKTIIKIIKGTIFDCNSYVVETESRRKEIFKQIKSKTLFCKPSDCGSGGKDIFTFRYSKGDYYDNSGKILSYDYLNSIKSSDWIIQESVKNSSDINEIYKYSTNSFRVLTYFKPGYGAKAIYCILKFGNNKAFTDNAHTGGVYVKVDTETGLLDETAYDENLFEHNEHPFTKLTFKGKRIKNIKDVIRIAESLGNKFPTLTFVGWDIALSPEGPVVLEGNSSPGLTIIQRTYGGMREFMNFVL